MDYLIWSQEYVNEARKVLRIIERKKSLLRHATLDEKHAINAQIMKLRNIYYDNMLIAKHLRERAKELSDAA